jgi:acetyltransferase-like isoleucine patch superfamily enzyme
VTFTNALYPRSPGAKADLRGPVLRAGAKVGAGAVLLPGVVIGRNALIGAGAVVVKDVADDAVVVGNPARMLRQVSEIAAYRTGESE